MTIRYLLDKINKEKPNSFSTDDLISFVNEVEAEVATQLNMDVAPSYSTEQTNPAEDPADFDVALLAPLPYDRLYVSYLKAMIDYANEEYASYQLNQEQHVQDFRDFVDFVVREGLSQRTATPTRFKNIY